MLSPTLLKELATIVGRDNCLTGRLDIEMYSYDSSAFIHPPEVIVLPGTVEELARVVRLTHEHGATLVPRGAGTSVSGGAVARHGGVMLVTTRLNRIVELDLLEESVLVECGVVNIDLNNYLAPYGYMFPPDPGSQKVSTLGGNIAENAGGMKGVKYGLTKNHVLGLEILLVDGRLARTGVLAEDRGGPDLTGIFLASEGAFAFITRALLKITPLPQSFRTVLAVFDDLENSGWAVSGIIAAGIIPTAMEIMDHEMIQALEDYLHLGFSREAQAMVLIEVDGQGPELSGQMSRIMDICRACGAVELNSADTPEERDKLWLARRSGNGAMGRIKPGTVVQDVTVPVNKLPEMLSLMPELGRRHKVTVVQLAHAGDGNLHPHFLYDPHDREEYQRCMEACKDMIAAALAVGGAISGEHGVGLEKIEFMEQQFTADELVFMALVKKTFDPQGRLNPGKVLPDEYHPPLAQAG